MADPHSSTRGAKPECDDIRAAPMAAPNSASPPAHTSVSPSDFTTLWSQMRNLLGRVGLTSFCFSLLNMALASLLFLLVAGLATGFGKLAGMWTGLVVAACGIAFVLWPGHGNTARMLILARSEWAEIDRNMGKPGTAGDRRQPGAEAG